MSVLFADLVGFTTLSERRDPEDVRALLSQYFARCRSIISRHGGEVEKFIGDAVMAVWGAPVAREDDAERAVRAALALTRAIDALGEELGEPRLQVRAGVLTGTAAVDAAQMHEGMVHGDTVNTASRLQSIAPPGHVFVDRATRRATEAAIAYEDSGTHEVKGREQPVHAWLAVGVVAGVGGARRRAGPEAPLVGRARELEAVVDAGERSALESCAVRVTVLGEAGTGKSRLAWEYFKYIDGIEAERWWHHGRCPAYGEGLAYWPLAEMIRARAGIGEDEEPASALVKLTDCVERFVPEGRERTLVLPRLAHLLDISRHGASEPADLFSGWRLFLERMAESDPVVLVFEDLQWATSGMLDFIDYLLEWSAERPLFVLCLGRPEMARTRPGTGETLLLGPLTDGQMHELLDGLVPGLPARLADQIVEQADGVPLYAVETVRMMRDRGTLVLEGSRYELRGPVEQLEVPETLQSLAASRLDNVGRAERSLLQDAAVLGMSFTSEAVAAVSGRPEADVRTTLDALTATQMLGRGQEGELFGEGQYHFLQGLLRTVALNTLARRDRKARHLAAAAHIRTLPGQTGELIEVEASHLLEAVRLDPDAPDADRIRAAAREKLALAGERSGSLALPIAAHTYYAQAAELADDPLARARLLARSGVAAGRAGRRAEALALLGEAIELLEQGNELAEAAQARALMADVLIAELRFDEAVALMDRARASITDEAALAELAARRAHVALLSGDYDRAYAEAEAALAIADPAGMHAVVANAQTTKAHTLYDKGRLTEAAALCSLALQIGLERDLSEQALRAYNNLAYYRIQGGRSSMALELLDSGIELARERGDRRWERDLLSQRIAVRAYRGEWDEALAEAEELRRGGEDVAERVAWHTRPLILAARGDVEGLSAWLERELPASEQWQEQSLDETVARATALRTLGRTAEAAGLAASAWREIQDTGRATSDLPMYFCALVDGIIEDGGTAMLRSGLPSGPKPLPSMRGLLAWLRGALMARDGDTAGACGELARAVALLEPVEHPFALARAQLDLGLCRARLGSAGEAQAALDGAADIFRRLRAAPSLERTEAARRSLCEGARVPAGALDPTSVEE